MTGTTGSGKSTTLAAMMNHINDNRPCHIVTVEDPIEYLHYDKKSIVNQREIGIEQGTALGRELARRTDYTAIFATADILAAGLISGLQEAGRRVPEDISIVGFDDLNLARLTSPQLTTVHQDVVQKGVIAAQMLINALQGDNVSAPRSVVLPVRLVSRQSVRCLNK